MREAVQRGIEPVIIPGVSAVTFAATACGLPTTTFTFIGFLPRKSGKRKTRLEAFEGLDQTLILFESPHRIGKLLGEIDEVFGPSTPVVLMREATKVHEQALRGTAEALLAEYSERKWKGEFTIAVWCGKALRGSEESEDFTPA
jgi:16S rRNA (cytidine1402-2'-O)-methyltransferase